MVRNAAEIYQSDRQYSVAAQKVKIAQGALKILSGSNNRPGYDTLYISDTARSFSKESVVALLDNCTDVSTSDLTFYFENYNNMPALLDAINFSEGFVYSTYNPDFKDFGVLSFKYNEVRQIIPNYAVPKMNARAYPAIQAEDNVLVLKDRSYYCYRAKNNVI